MIETYVSEDGIFCTKSGKTVYQILGCPWCQMRNGKFYEETNDKILSQFIIGQSTGSKLATHMLKVYSKLLLITA